MSAYESLIRPLLFCLPPEFAHHCATSSLQRSFPWSLLADTAQPNPRLETKIGSLILRSPIGLSAGFDKNAQALLGLQHLSFGYLTVGSVLPEKRAGNPKPRLVRLPEKDSLLNCYGLPSQGRERCAMRLEQFAGIKKDGTIVVANIDAPSIDGYLDSIARMQDSTDAIELGLQCPNNREDIGDLHNPKNFEQLLQKVRKTCHKPIFIKFGFADNDDTLQNRMALIDIAIRYGVSAVVVPGIRKIADDRLSLGIGAISGKEAFQRNLEVVRTLSEHFGQRIAIKSNGGVFDGRDAFEVLSAGARSIDIFTAFVYRGWRTPRRMAQELLEVMDAEGVSNLAELRP